MRLARSGGLLLAAGLAVVLVATAAEAREAEPTRGEGIPGLRASAGPPGSERSPLAGGAAGGADAHPCLARRPGCRVGHARGGRASAGPDSSHSAPADRCGRRQGPCPHRLGRRAGASRQGGARPGGESRAAARRRFRSAGRDGAADPVPGLRRVRHGARPEWPLCLGERPRREPDPALPVSRGGNGSRRLPAASGAACLTASPSGRTARCTPL